MCRGECPRSSLKVGLASLWVLRVVRSRCSMATPRAFPHRKHAAQRRLLDDSYAPALSSCWFDLRCPTEICQMHVFALSGFVCPGRSFCLLAWDSLASVPGRRSDAARPGSAAQEATVAGDAEAGVSAAVGAAGLRVAAPASSASAQDLANFCFGSEHAACESCPFAFFRRFTVGGCRFSVLLGALRARSPACLKGRVRSLFLCVLLEFLNHALCTCRFF